MLNVFGHTSLRIAYRKFVRKRTPVDASQHSFAPSTARDHTIDVSDDDGPSLSFEDRSPDDDDDDPIVEVVCRDVGVIEVVKLASSDAPSSSSSSSDLPDRRSLVRQSYYLFIYLPAALLWWMET